MVGLTITFFGIFFFIYYGTSRCGPVSDRSLVEGNLRDVVSAWQVVEHENTSHSNFNPELVKRHLPKWYSPITQRENRHQQLLVYGMEHGLRYWAMPLLPYGCLMALLAKKPVRRASVVVALLGLIALSTSFLVRPIGNFLWPDSFENFDDYAYIDDFAYVTNVDWRNGETDTIIAYQKRPLEGYDKRAVAFVYGDVKSLSVNNLQERLKKQGLDLVVDQPSVAK